MSLDIPRASPLDSQNAENMSPSVLNNSSTKGRLQYIKGKNTGLTTSCDGAH